MLARTLEAGRRPARARRSGPLVVLALAALAAITVPACGDERLGPRRGDGARAASSASSRRRRWRTTDLDRMGEGQVGHAAHLPALGSDRSDRGRRRLRLRAPSTPSCSARPRTGSTCCRSSSAPRTGSPDARRVKACDSTARPTRRARRRRSTPGSEFVAAAVERYGPGGALWAENPDVDPRARSAIWQIWNEQNSPTFYQPRARRRRATQACSARRRAAIRARDPEADGGARAACSARRCEGSRRRFTAWEYLRQLYEIRRRPTASTASRCTPTRRTMRARSSCRSELMRDEVERAGDDDAEPLDHRGRLGLERSAEPARSRAPRVRRDELTEAFDYFLDKRARVEHRGRSPGTRGATPPTIDVCDWCGGSGLFAADSLDEPEARLGARSPRLPAAAESDAPPAIAGRMTTVSESATAVSRPSSTRTSSSLR